MAGGWTFFMAGCEWRYILVRWGWVEIYFGWVGVGGHFLRVGGGVHSF